MSKVFYLKVNRDENYTYRNLQNWVDIVGMFPDSVAYIMCDKKEIREKIYQKISFFNTKVIMMESGTLNDELEHMLLNICVNSWRNAGLAHLTTFLHAKEQGFKEFWNIDADDTYICLSQERTVEVLMEAESYAKEKKMDLFSLDMWGTRYYRRGLETEWSFGICYVNNQVDWLGALAEHCTDELYKQKNFNNIDHFFCYLRMLKKYSIELFYVENMKFLHYSDDFFRRLFISGLYHWKNGVLRLPVLEACLGSNYLTEIAISKDTIKLDIGITDEEVSTQFINSILDKNLYEALNKASDIYAEKKESN